MAVFSRLALLLRLTACGLFALAVPLTRAQGVGPPKPAAESEDRAARVAERYRAMLKANPAEGIALDRLWKFHEEQGTTADLLKNYEEAAASGEADVATLLVDGYLLKKTGQFDAAAALFKRAAARDPANPLPEIASGDLAVARDQPAEAARWYGEALGKLREGDRRRADLLIKQGNALFAAGQTTEAAGIWEQVAALNPADYALRRRLADADEKNGLSDRAVAQHEYIRDHASPEEKALALRELGRLHEAQGQFDAAKDALESGLTLTARDNWLHADLQTRLIRLYERAGRGAELAAQWRAAAEQAPRDLGGYGRLAALAEVEGNPREEQAALEKIVALNPRDRESTLKLATLLGQAGERERAEALYDTLLKQQPGNLALILARADLEVQLGRMDAAVQRVEDRVAQSPADESVLGPALEFFLAHRLDTPAERLLRAEVGRQPGASEGTLALAKFLYSQRRGAEAGVVLEAYAARPGEGADRAKRFSQIADAYREAGATEDALRAWQTAAGLLPSDPAPLLAVADLQRVRGDTPAAIETLQRAATLSASGPVRLAVERRLFDTLRGNGETGEGVAKRMRPPAMRGAPARPNPDSPLGKYLQGLAENAAQQRTVDAYLRLASWLSWAHDAPGALDAAGKALALEPANPLALKLSAQVATESRQPALAETMLADLIQADPAHADAAMRELATLKLQTGDTGEALALYERLQARAPGSRTALTDLALAQQRVDRWLDAVATWERAMALPGATTAQKAEVRRSLLAAYAHVGQFSRAAEVLAKAVDEQTDLSAKEDLFRQWIDLERQHGQLDQLTAQFEERLRRKPDDYFTLVAMAQLRRETGDPAAGYALLRKALYSTPDPAQPSGYWSGRRRRRERRATPSRINSA